MLKSIYIDPPKGDTKTIRAALAALPLYGFEVHSQRQSRNNPEAADIRVRFADRRDTSVRRAVCRPACLDLLGPAIDELKKDFPTCSIEVSDFRIEL